MASSPLRTQRLKTRPVWNATRRRRERERAIAIANPGTTPTVDDGSKVKVPGEMSAADLLLLGLI